MMTFVFGLLTVVLVVLSLFLILLVLVQLPKKDAGTGIAFGGAAADALFGAGSGNVLTKITKYSIISFFAVVIILSYVHDNLTSGPDMSTFAKKVQQAAAAAPAPVAPAPTHAVTPAPTNTFKVLSATVATNAVTTPAK
jgi:preprotein translocase subunit SecG